MVDEKVLKVLKTKLHSLEVEILIHRDKLLTEKQKEKLLNLAIQVYEKEMEGITTVVTCNKCNIKIYTPTYSATLVTFVYCKDDATIKKFLPNKFYHKGVQFNSLEELKDQQVENCIIKDFDMNNITSSEMQKCTDFKYLLETKKYNTNRFNETYDRVFNWEDLAPKFDKLFGRETTLGTAFKDNDLRKNLDEHLYYITNVFEGYNQTRYVQFQNLRSLAFIIVVIKTPNNVYNFCDVNRLFYIRDMDYMNDTWMAFEEMSIETLKLTLPNFRAFIKSNERLNLNRYVDNSEVLTARNKYLLIEKKQERELKLAEIKNKRYKDAVDAIHKKPFVKNGISFEKHKITYEGITVDTKKHFDFKKYLTQIRIDALVDFNTLFNDVMKTICVRFLHDDISWDLRHNIKLKCLTDEDNLRKLSNITLEIDGKKLKITDDVDRYFINGIRINKHEIPDVVGHIFCYKTLKEYEKFLETVSKCSLKFHNAISNGIKHSFNLPDARYYDQTMVEFKMVRNKNKNFLIVGKKQFQISNTNRIIDGLINDNGYKAFIMLILNSVNISLKDIKVLLKDGVSRYTEALKKSEALLKNTMKTFDVIEKSVNGESGFFLKGKSGNEYLISKDARSIWQVRGSQMEYRCVVDRSSANQVGRDSLVSRIFALANDSLIAEQVKTLKV